MQQKFGTAAPASDSLAKGELAIRFVAANHTASSSSKLYFGEGDSANLRQFGFGITDGSTQSGVAIGENLTFSAGTGLDVSVSGTTVQFAQDLSEFADMTADVVGSQDEMILLDNGAERRKRIDEIKLSQFNNDLDTIAGGLTVTGNLVPSADDTHDLGTTSAAWQDLHIEGNIESTDAMSINSGAGDISFGPAENLTLSGSKRFEFRDDALYIHSSVDGQLDITSDDEIEMNATDVDINANAHVSGNFGVGGTTAFEDAIDVDGNISVALEIQHKGDTNNSIAFGTDTQTYETGGSTRLDISDSGVRLGAANARVTTILDEDNMSTNSATALATQQSIKAYVDSNSGSGIALTDLSVGSEGSASGDGAIAYNNSSGVFTYTPPVHDSLSGFVSNEHIDHSGVSITAGDGLTGGGTIASTRTLNVVGGTGITANANDIQITDGGVDTTQLADDGVTYAKIQNVSATNRILGRDSSGAGVIEEITPANLRTMLNVADGATANAGDITGVTAGTGLSGGGSSGGVTLTTDDSAIVHDDLSGFVANEHIDHSGVSITAGNGLTGGGTIASSRTLNVVGGTGITANSNDIQITDGGVDTTQLADDGVTYAKIQNVSATNRTLGRDSSGAGVIEEITPANLRTMINVADGADDYDSWTLAVNDGSSTSSGGVGSANTVTFAQGTGLDVAKSSNTVTYSVDVSDFMTNGSNNRIVTATGTDAMNAEANFTFDGEDATLENISGQAYSGRLYFNSDDRSYIYSSLPGWLTIRADGAADSSYDGDIYLVADQVRNTTRDFRVGDTGSSSDVVMTFDTSGNDGVLTWDQSADTFVFSDIVDVPNLKIGGTQGSDGQVLTSTGSGVAWENPSGGGGGSGDITGVDLTGGTGVTISSETNTTSGDYSSTISIGQDVGTTDNVSFGRVDVDASAGHVQINNGYVEINGDEGGDARILLFADQGDDNDDKWRIQNTAANEFHIANKATGTFVNHLTLTNSAQLTLGERNAQNGRYQIVEGGNVLNGFSGSFDIPTAFIIDMSNNVNVIATTTVTVTGGIITSVA